MDFFDPEWYPYALVGRTGSETPKEQVVGKSKITKEVRGTSKINKDSKADSKVIP